MIRDTAFLHRCRQLALLGAGRVAPNPMVGAVLVAENRIIGEGWHAQYGQAHAEVQAVASVRAEDRPLLSQSTLYVSLEPCCIHGNTPPCTDLVLRHAIPRVVVATLDYTEGMPGKSVALLREHGVEVKHLPTYAPWFDPAHIRNHFVQHRRPYIILKFAQSRDGLMGRPDRQVWISSPFSKRLVHKWRAATDAIMVGTQTALLDRPQLTTRHYFGPHPLRIVPDTRGRLPVDHPLFDQAAPTWVLDRPDSAPLPEHVHKITTGKSLTALMNTLFDHGISSLLVEGGRRLLQSFLEANLWDEARIFTSPIYLGKGVQAPRVFGKEIDRFELGEDQVRILVPLS